MVAKYVDPDGKEVASDVAGELWMSGPNVFGVSQSLHIVHYS